MSRAHPDAVLLGRARRALDWWAGADVPTPTSSVTGGGAIAAVEQAIRQLIAGRPALALPNATYGLRTALLAVGVRPGDDVLVDVAGWPAGRAAVRSLGARPVAVASDPELPVMDPDAAASARTSRTRAVLVTHMYGVCADVPRLRSALGDGVPVVEDAAQAFGASLDGRPAGSLGDVAVFSFGPGKVIDVGELAVFAARDEDLLDAALRHSQHPVRQRLRGLPAPVADGLTGRAAPLSAVLAAYELHRWPARSARLRGIEAGIHRRLAAAAGGPARLAVAPRRAGEPGRVPVLAGPDEELSWPDLPGVTVAVPDRRVRLLVVDEDEWCPAGRSGARPGRDGRPTGCNRGAERNNGAAASSNLSVVAGRAGSTVEVI